MRKFVIVPVRPASSALSVLLLILAGLVGATGAVADAADAGCEIMPASVDFGDVTLGNVAFELVVVRTARQTNYEEKLKKKIRTSGCAQGTVFGDLMERFEEIRLDGDARLRTTWLASLTRTINTTPSLYLRAGAIHGCALCRKDRVLLYMEDVGRHNAVDKIAGYMFRHGIEPHDKIFYTTGRLTSEMVIKTVQMRIPILISRSGFTAWGVDLARDAGLTLIGRARGRRFLALAGEERLIFDDDGERMATGPD